MKWSLICICLSAVLLSDQANAKALDNNTVNDGSGTDETNDIDNEAKPQSSTGKPAQSKKDASDVLIELDLKETTTQKPSARRYGRRYVKSHEKHILDSILSPQVVRSSSNDAPSMKLDLNLQSFLQLVNSLLASQRLNSYADTIGRKAASLYSTLRKHSKKEIVKPQVVEFRSGKPSLVYAFNAGDILQSLDNFLASTLVKTYTDQLAKRAGAIVRAATK